jgi:hypothetical protein
MGLIIKKIAIEDYIEKDVLFSKLIRGNLSFSIETHHLEGGKHLQIFFYRDHPRIKEFIALNDKKNHLTIQNSHTISNAGQIKLVINDDLVFMMSSNPEVEINVTEYNFNQKLSDFDKGKVAVLIDIVFNQETDNTKLISELKALNKMEEK